MQSRWVQAEADRFVDRYADAWGAVLATRTYSTRLLGAEPSLALHGGGNTSVKDWYTSIVGERRPALYVKVSGADMATIAPAGHVALDLAELRKLRVLAAMDDATMARELRARMFPRTAALDHQSEPGFSPALTPSIETLVHALLPGRFIDHTHADAVLALTNQSEGDRLVREVLGDDVVVLPYIAPGFLLARAAADALERSPGARAIVWSRHGIVTWGETARDSYEAMIDLVTKAERHLESRSTRFLRAATPTPVAVATERAGLVAPMLRGLLAPKTGDPDRPHRRMIVRPLVTRETLEFVDADGARDVALTPPLTSDHLIRTKAWPAFVEAPDYENVDHLHAQLEAAVRGYVAKYEAYVGRHADLMPAGMSSFDALPRVVLMPGLGAFCAGPDLASSTIARDITAQTLAVKAKVAAFGAYQGLGEADLFKMEYRPLQHAKLEGRGIGALSGEVALVTGAAGAIGSGVCRELLEQGCLVAATDLPGAPLDTLVAELAASFGPNVIGVPLDVTDAASVATAFRTVAGTWGGVDLVIANAGIAHVASLDRMELEVFRRLERVNIEGTLLVLSESARHFRAQATGGDVVLVSTKNVFAPGAKFGAYSATKAAAHQLARIASLEMAELDVRVNMVSPDAVFSDGGRKSGLWAEVGPDRMRARGLDQAGLEAYYRSRNLLKAGVTAKHVANAVMFFATRQTPTTGSTIPVDGGLPDATPR
jgi:rhamnose utilization protein RhaD (predicted bifunctional aldolase and dehydrogenase)/NAD(P)-dependent dehydrogenase (short-subunit alcohol dehydrogenase family)